MALRITQKALSPAVRRGLSTPQLSSASRALPLAVTTKTQSLAPQPQQQRSFYETTRNDAPSGGPGSGMMGFGGSSIPPSYFQKPSLPANTVIRFVPQQTAWIVERMGKFNRILQPGLAILIPFLDRIAYVKSLRKSLSRSPARAPLPPTT